jgi:hypothetical protein
VQDGRMAELTNERIVHELKNQLAIIVGFCDLLIADTPDDDPRAQDLREVHIAARQAMAAMVEVARRLRIGVLQELE